MATQSARPKATPLNKDQLFGVQRPLRTKVVEIPDYGPVTVQELMSYQRDDLDSRAVIRTEDGKGNVKTTQDYRNYRARAIAYSLVNPDNTRMFPNAETDDKQVDEVAKLPASIVDLIFDDGVDQLSHLTKKSQEAVGKGSSGTSGNGSSSK